MTGRHPATAAQRTDLLHRMLLLRHDPGPGAGFGAGAEAVAVGLRCALGPADTLVPADRHDGPALAVELAHTGVLGHRFAVVVCFVGVHAPAELAGTLGSAIADRLPVL